MLKLLNNEKLIVGYDLKDDYSQISYCVADSENVETLSMVAGVEDFNIPTVLCKREGVNQWFCGREAIRYAETGQGILIQNLLGLAVDGEPVLIEGNAFDPVSLLTLFLKRSLGMLAQVSSPDRISALMITCRKLHGRILDVLCKAVEGLKLRTDNVFFQSHTESFYHYMLRQEPELWKARTVLLESLGTEIVSYSMECNYRTNPVVVYIKEKSYAFTSQTERMDSELLSLSEEICAEGYVSGVYLIGDVFSGDWMQESLRYLCRGRRLFQGNNLYSKGACYGMLERLKQSEAGKSHVFLGDDKLKANVGMKLMHQGEEIYCALLDAGTTWFEAEQTFDFYLQGGNRIELMVTALTGGYSKVEEVVLEELPGELSRLRAHLRLRDENHILVEIEDLGLGAFRPASHRIWKQEIEL